MSDAYMVLMIGIGATIAQAVFWYWINAIKNNSQDNTNKLEGIKSDIAVFKLEVSKNYQSKEDAHKDIQLIMETLKEIKVDVKEVSNKLDKKADKP